jgi:hypothetical protein
MESIPGILETAEESVINELTDILTKKMQNGLPTETARDIRRKAGEVVGAGPIGRVNYDIYGILDLIQQHVQTMGSGKIVSKVVEISLQVAKQSPYKYLRCKAFEVLAQLNSRPNLGEAPAEAKVEEMIYSSGWPTRKLQKINGQWDVMTMRAAQTKNYFRRLRVDSNPSISFQVSTFLIRTRLTVA